MSDGKIYCGDCNKEMESKLTIAGDQRAQVTWHKDNSPDDCQNPVIMTLWKNNQALIIDNKAIIEALHIACQSLTTLKRPHRMPHKDQVRYCTQALNRIEAIRTRK